MKPARGVVGYGNTIRLSNGVRITTPKAGNLALGQRVVVCVDRTTNTIAQVMTLEQYQQALREVLDAESIQHVDECYD